MSQPQRESPATMKKKNERKLKLRKINLQDRTDDIPNCPSIEEGDFDPAFISEGATAEVSEWSIGENNVINKDSVQTAKEAVAKNILQRHREKDLEELYGLIDSSSSEEEYEEERAKNIKDLNDPVSSIPWESYRKYSAPSGDVYDPEKEAAEKERAKRRREQAEEMYDNVIWASLSLGKQTAFLFGKMINFSGKYPTPAGIALIIFGLYFAIMYLELSAAAFAEWCIQLFWPTTRLFLRGSERLLRKMASFLHEMDDLGQSTYCDMASLWCERYEMLCEYRCSFIDMAWERTRN